MNESDQPTPDRLPLAIPALPTPPLSGPVEPHVIAADLPCSRCAYNLRGLTDNMRCPECGTPIAQSLYGNWLRLADPEWLKKLKLGASLKLWGLLVGFVLSFLIGFAGGFLGWVTAAAGVFAMLIAGAGLIGGILSLVSTFLITAPEPTIGKAEDQVTLRKVIRFSAGAGLVGGVLSHGGAPGALETVMVIAGSALSVVGLVATFGEFVYLRRFARRIPDLKLAQRTSFVMWGFGITAGVTALGAFAVVILSIAGVGPFGPGGPFTVTTSGASVTASGNLSAGTGPAGWLTGMGAAFLGCFIGLAFLAFVIFYVGLLIRYYRAFKQAAAEAELIALGQLPPFPIAAAPCSQPPR